MLFIIALAGIIVIAVVMLSRRRSDGSAAAPDRGPGDTAPRNMPRREQWDQKHGPQFLDRLSDPREAAAILLVQTASYDGEVTPAQKSLIENLMTANFGCDADMAQGLYSFGRMAIGQIGDAAGMLPRLMRPLKDALTLSEIKEFVRMLETVSEAEGEPSERQHHLISEVRRLLWLNSVS